MILKKISKVVAMSLLMVLMTGNTVLAASGTQSAYYSHNWVMTGVPNVNSWLYMHPANTDGYPCHVYGWISREYPQCTKCGRMGKITDTQHERHEYCKGLDY